MHKRHIAAWLVTACIAFSPAQAEVQTVRPIIPPTVVPELAPAPTAGDFVIAYGTSSGVYGVPFVDGAHQPSIDLLQNFNRGSDFASVSLAYKAGGGLLLSYWDRTRTQPSLPWSPSVSDLWVKPLNGALQGPTPRQVDTDRANGTPPTLESALAADTREENCCALLAYAHPWNGWLGLEILDANGAALASRKELRINGAAELRVRRPALAYQSDAGFFLVVYETRRDIRARRVYATPSGSAGGDFKWISDELIVATKTQPARYEDLVDGHPHVAYSPELRQFLVTWLDHAQSTGTQRRVMARTLTRAGLPSGSSFAVQSSCAVGNWSCFLLGPTADGAARVFAMPGGFQVSYPAMPWNQTDRVWGVLAFRLTAASTGFNFSSRWLPGTLLDERITALRTAYDPRSGIAAATWLASTRSSNGSQSFENTSLKIGDFLP